MSRLRLLFPLLFLIAQNLFIFKDHYFNDVGFPWDFPMGYYAIVAFWTSAVRHNIFPEWIPFQQMGFPFALQVQSGLYYPPLWLFPIFNIPYSLNAAVVTQCLHVLLGGLGMFLFLQQILKNNNLALVGAVIFQFFGGFYSNAEHPDIVRSFAFAPWIFWVFTLNIAEKVELPRRALLIPLLLYLLATGGYLGNLISSLLVMSLYISFQLVEGYVRQHDYHSLIRTAIYVTGLTLLGLTMTSIALAPVWMVKEQMIRYNQYESIGRAVFWVEQLPSLFLTNRLVPGEISMTSAYLTLPALILACFVSLENVKRFWPFAVIGIIGFLMAGGEKTIFWMILTTVAPPLRFSRFPSSDYRVFIVIPIIIFALQGSKTITAKEIAKRSVVIRIMFILLWLTVGILIAYPDWHNQSVLAIGLIALATITLALHGYRHHVGTSRIVVGILLLVLLDGVRVLSNMNTWRDPAISTLYNRNNWPYEKDRQLVVDNIFSSLPSRRPPRLPSPHAHQFSWGGYVDGRYMMYDLGPGFLQVVNVVRADPLYQQYMQMEWLPLFMDPALAQPGARSVDISNSELEGYIEVWKSRASTYITQTHYGINDITYQVYLDEPRLMMENEIYFPGWTARLISATWQKQIQAISINGVFRAWELPAGQYRMEARFEFPNIWLCRGISLLAFIIWLAILTLYWRGFPGRLQYTTKAF